MMSSNSQAVNLLFTSAGRRVELLKAFRQAYEALNLQGSIIATDIDPLAPALRIADKAYLVPRFTSEDYIPSLTEICKREKVNLVFPLIDPDIPILAQHRALLEKTGAQLGVVSAPAATLTRDKWLTKKFFQELGIKTAQAWHPNELNPLSANYPLFIKPCDGSGGHQTYKVNNSEELEFLCKYVSNPMIEEYLPGPEITSDIIAWLDSTLLAIVSRKRIEARSGEVVKGVTIRDNYIIDACKAIAYALPAQGPITVQCIMKDGIPHFTEINARFGGGIPLGIAAGVDSPKWLLARFAGIELDIPPLGTYETGLYLTRFDSSFYITESEYRRMASGHLSLV